MIIEGKTVISLISGMRLQIDRALVWSSPAASQSVSISLTSPRSRLRSNFVERVEIGDP